LKLTLDLADEGHVVDVVLGAFDARVLLVRRERRQVARRRPQLLQGVGVPQAAVRDRHASLAGRRADHRGTARRVDPAALPGAAGRAVQDRLRPLARLGRDAAAGQELAVEPLLELLRAGLGLEERQLAHEVGHGLHVAADDAQPRAVVGHELGQLFAARIGEVLDDHFLARTVDGFDFHDVFLCPSSLLSGPVTWWSGRG
jgi:hypothetical protein